MSFKFQTVHLSAIDINDNTYHITTETGIDELVDSIYFIGLLNSPIVKKKKSNYIVVSGFRRISACAKLGWLCIESKVIATDTGDLECAKYAISDNSFQRPLNLIEQSRAVSLLCEIIKDPQSLPKIAQVLNLPENSSYLEKMKFICKLPKIIQDGILSKTISLAIALTLGELDRDTGITFAELFNSLQVSLSKQREIITFVEEIALLEEITIQAVLKNKNVQEIINNDNIDKVQKTGKLRFYLKKRRFPKITAAEDVFNRYVKELKLGNRAKLIPPKYFEGSDYSLSLRFKNMKELEERNALLEKITKNPAIQKILSC